MMIRKNVLGGARSPYLLQHANNPVFWQEWNDELLAYAQKQNKPLLISIGYAACHWCHVMEEESFMDVGVAQVMNEHFVCIKVDREERPDIDHIYMNAVQILTKQGGWPLNAFALPDGRPFYACTYLPRERWMYLLSQIAAVYREDFEKVEQQAEALSEGVRSLEYLPDTNGKDNDLNDLCSPAVENLLSSVDTDKGGFRGAPKFPLPAAWEYLLSAYDKSGDEKVFEAVTITLDKMAMGGIYDQIGGGFARYSVDADWFVPHFEKMLYDNAQLISLYAHAFQLTGKPLYRKVIEQSCEFLERELEGVDGGFYASLNADSEGEEGRFYVWTWDELADAFEPADQAIVKHIFGFTESGNWEEGKNIAVRNAGSFFAEDEKNVRSAYQNYARLRDKLFLRRAKRIRPTTDDKIIVAWNALLIKAYTDAYRAVGNNLYIEKARSIHSFLEKYMQNPSGGCFRTFRGSKASGAGFLDDYALWAEAGIALYETTLEIHYLNHARELTRHVLEHFDDPGSSMFFYTGRNTNRLIARSMEISDNVIPASNSVMAHVLFRLGILYELPEFTQRSEEMLRTVLERFVQQPAYFGNWGRLVNLMMDPPNEVCITGDDPLPMLKKLQSHYLPNCIFLGGTGSLPLLQGKSSHGPTTIYVCRERVCRQPVLRAEEALAQLKK